METNHTVHSAILWPDHVIGKRESRSIREKHNALYNSRAELLAALQGLCKELPAHIKMDVRKHFSLMVAEAAASKAIHKATVQS